MKFLIQNLGPIRCVTFELKDFTVITGYQSSGKSTIAKAVYLFRTVKDDTYDALSLHRYALSAGSDKVSAADDIRSRVKKKFLGIFGSSEQMNHEMHLRCDYDNNTFVELSLATDSSGLIPNDVRVTLSDPILEFLALYQKNSDRYSEDLAAYLDRLFCDPYKSIYIPAGRSMITILGDQFVAFYSRLSDDGKRLIDTCTLDYLNMILSVRPQFTRGLEGVVRDLLQTAENLPDQEKQRENAIFHLAEDLSDQILSGHYYIENGEERLRISGEESVRMSLASSGQQEALWILNILFYYMFRRPANFIIEEPESHLFPETQSRITEYIALVQGQGHQVLVTTHSPYILGTADILLYAGNLERKLPERSKEIRKIVRRELELDIQKTDAFFVADGSMTDIIDPELEEISQDSLDQVSGELNNRYNALAGIEGSSL